MLQHVVASICVAIGTSQECLTSIQADEPANTVFKNYRTSVACGFFYGSRDFETSLHGVLKDIKN